MIGAPPEADDPTQRADWHLIVRTRGGKVSILKNLTLRMAREARQRLRPRSEVEHENAAKVAAIRGETMGYSSWSWTPTDSDIEQSDIIGPESWDGCKGAMQHDMERVDAEWSPDWAVCRHCGHGRVMKPEGA